MSDRLQRARNWETPLVVFAALALALFAGSFFYLRGFKRQLRAEVDRELSALADVKVSQVVAWRDRQAREWGQLLSNPFAFEALERLLAGDPDPRLRLGLLQLLSSEAEGEGAQVDLVGLEGKVVLSTTVAGAAASADDRRLLQLSRERHAPVFSDLEREGHGLVVAIARPVRAPGGELGLLVRFDLAQSLNPIAQWRPTLDSSTEAVIARREGREVVPLTRLLDAPATLRFPLDGNAPIARAVRGETGVMLGRDRHGREVLAALRHIPGSTWFLAVKADVAEVLAPARDRAMQLGVAMTLFLALSGALLLAWWRAQVAALRVRQEEVTARTLRQRFDAFWTQARDIVLVLDRHGAIQEVNDGAVQQYGRPRAELLGMHIASLRTPDEAAAWPGQWARVWREGHLEAETEHRRKDGSTFPVELSIQVVAAGEEQFVFGVCRDITERRRADRVAREQAALLANLSDGVLALDREGTITAWASGAERMYGHPAADVLGRKAREVLQTRFAGTTESGYWAEIEARGTARTEAVQRRKDGVEIPLEITATALRDAAGRLVGAVSVNRDLTEQRRQEAEQKRLHSELVFADRLASIGTLAAGVAHEINNPLSYLIANLEYVEDQLAGTSRAEPVEPAELVGALRESRDGARRIGEIVRGLRTFSRRETGSVRRAVDVRAAAEAAVRMAQGQARPRARLITDLVETRPVLGSEHELAQVVLNLVMNGIQAIPEGTPERNEVRVTTRVLSGGQVELSVSDTGAGIAPEHLARIFDPFFTTKQVGEGSGLGLAICHGLVEGLGGSIAVESTPGLGTCFTVRLPPAPPIQEELQLPAAPSHRRGRILVIDDEPLVLSSVRRTLGAEHDVETFADPHAAVERLAAGELFDLVLCDLAMPELSGMDCYEELVRRRPEAALRMVFLTGGAFTPRARRFLEENPGRWLEKPFDPEALRSRVAAALAARA